MAVSSLFIDKYLNNEDCRIRLIGLREPVEAAIVSDVEIGASATYQSDSGFKINDLIQKPMKFVAKVRGDMSSFRVNNVQETILDWMGSENMPLNLSMMFVAIRPEDDVRYYPRILKAACYATLKNTKDVGGPKKILGITVPGEKWVSKSNAPNNYQGADFTKPQGVLSVYIGHWFKAPNIWVLENASFTYSKETIGSGLPLYCTGSISLRTFRAPYPSEVETWLSVSKIAQKEA